MVKRKKIKNHDLIQVYIPDLDMFTLVSFVDHSKDEFVGKKDLLHSVFYCWDIFSKSEFSDDISILELDLLCNPLLNLGFKNLQHNWKILRANELLQFDHHLNMDLRGFLHLRPGEKENIEYYEQRKWRIYSLKEEKYYSDLSWDQVAHLEQDAVGNTQAIHRRIHLEYCKNYFPSLKFEEIKNYKNYFKVFFYMKSFMDISPKDRFYHIRNI